MSIDTISLTRAQLTRVGYVDTAIPAQFVGLDAAAIRAMPWATPLWAVDDQVRIGTAAWFAAMGACRLVFDPVQAADAVLRADRDTERAQQASIAALFTASGWAPDSVDLVVLTHIEGIGMVARREDDGSWAPFFPKARVLVSREALRAFGAGRAVDENADADARMEREAWQALIDQGRVAAYTDGEQIVPGLRAEVRGGHGPGHAVLHFEDHEGATEASFIGHLAVSPIHLASGECAALNADPVRARTLLDAVAQDGRTLIGPLWPAPGHGRWAEGRVRAGR
ncbi:MAG TPA: hypothetical protein VLA56_11855 [Pseudomonadales bacterium]|nr:hypothetical protein [Pseudomonadales bacterium]